MDLKVQLRHWSRLDQAINFWFLFEFSEKIRILFWEKFPCIWIVYCTVNDNVADMNTTRPQLPGERLRECSFGHLVWRVLVRVCQVAACLGWAECWMSRAPPETGRGSSDDDGSLTSPHHLAGNLAAKQEGGQSGHLPHLQHTRHQSVVD